MLILGHCLSSQTAACSPKVGHKRARIMYTHLNTHNPIYTQIHLHTDKGMERNDWKSVSLAKFTQLPKCGCFCSGPVGIFWKSLVLVGLPKFPKISQSSPKFPKHSRIAFSFVFVVRGHTGWNWFGKVWVQVGFPR